MILLNCAFECFGKVSGNEFVGKICLKWNITRSIYIYYNTGLLFTNINKYATISMKHKCQYQNSIIVKI